MSERLDVAERLRSKIEAPEVKHFEGRVIEIRGDQRVRRVILEEGSSVDVGGIFIEVGRKGTIELVSVSVCSSMMMNISCRINPRSPVCWCCSPLVTYADLPSK
jgi:hypothetical protein